MTNNPRITDHGDEHFRVLFRHYDGSVVVESTDLSAEAAERTHRRLELGFMNDGREAWIESQVLGPWRKRHVSSQGIGREHNYNHKELTDILDNGPDPETDKFHLKVMGKDMIGSHWLSITADQLATIAAVLDGPS